jgi:diguanylate cyclase (GGDEF)-like protein
MSACRPALRLLLFLAGLWCCLGSPAAWAQSVRVGVLSFRSLEQTQAQWAPTIAYLQQRLPGYRFELHPLYYPDLDQAVRARQLEFVFTNPEHYVLLRSRHGLAAIVTLMPLADGGPVNEFGGVILTNAGRKDIRALDDLKGKLIASPSEESLGGYLMQRWTLEKAGIGLGDLAGVHFTGMPHDNVVMAVVSGQADAGFVRTGVLEAMAREGRISLQQIKVLNRQEDTAFPQVRSTELYPEWPFSAVRGLPEPLVKAVSQALLDIPPTSAAALAGHYYGFSPPGDYTPVEAVLLRLGMHPDRLEHFGLADIFSKYAVWIITILALSLLALLTVVFVLVRDRHKIMEAEEQVRTLAFYDTLTNLPNRRLLLDRLRHALAASARSKHYGALLFIDLDDFKNFNDTLGHDKGDLLLQEVSQRLQSCVRKGDTVARLGGDEFVVMLEDLHTLEQPAAKLAEGVGEKILASLRQPFQLVGHERYVTSSIGVALFVDYEESVDELLKRADLAMYQAKSAGRNVLFFFDPAMQANVEARVTLEQELRQAIKEGQFDLYYQVQVDDRGQPLGAEALLRWRHPRRGLLLPEAFLAVAEDTGLIKTIGLWVLESVCRQLSAWQDHPLLGRLNISVNVSARQFRRPDFVAELQATLQRECPGSTRLKLELTEGLLLADMEETIARMNVLQSRGVSFSLDDFGMGFSSLAYLKRMPLAELKIDQSFVRDLLHDANDATIAQTMIALGQTLGLSVVAEGVETEEQKAFLLQQGCRVFQGYLFGVPMPLAELERQLLASL